MRLDFSVFGDEKLSHGRYPGNKLKPRASFSFCRCSHGVSHGVKHGIVAPSREREIPRIMLHLVATLVPAQQSHLFAETITEAIARLHSDCVRAGLIEIRALPVLRWRNGDIHH